MYVLAGCAPIKSTIAAYSFIHSGCFEPAAPGTGPDALLVARDLCASTLRAGELA